MKLELSIFDRLMLWRFLPSLSNYRDAILIKSIKEKVQLTQDELKYYNVKTEGNQTTWTGKAMKTIDFTELEIMLLKEGAEKMDKESKIEPQPQFIDLFTKIKEVKNADVV